MQIGIGLPVAGHFASPEAIVKIAQRAEKLDCAAVWTFERVSRTTAPMPVPGREGVHARHCPIFTGMYTNTLLDTLAFVAVHTQKIKLGTSIVDASFQSPPQLGKRFATLDQLSHGRVIAGWDRGRRPTEFVATDTPLKRRGAGFEEYVHALRAVWGPDPVVFEGRFYKIPEIRHQSQTGAESHIPVLMGAGSHVKRTSVPRLADGGINRRRCTRSRWKARSRAFLGMPRRGGTRCFRNCRSSLAKHRAECKSTPSIRRFVGTNQG